MLLLLLFSFIWRGKLLTLMTLLTQIKPSCRTQCYQSSGTLSCCLSHIQNKKQLWHVLLLRPSLFEANLWSVSLRCGCPTSYTQLDLEPPSIRRTNFAHTAQLSSDVWPLMNLRETAKGTGRRELTVISEALCCAVWEKRSTAAQIFIEVAQSDWQSRIILFAPLKKKRNYQMPST